MTRRTVYGTCSFCEATCGIEVQLEGRDVVRLRGDDADVFSRGHVCPKAVGMRDLHADPDRLRRPLRRTARGDFEEIGWEEAWDFAAERIARVREAGGANAVALYRGNPGIHDYATILGANVLVRALGTKNVYSAGALDTWPRWVQAGSMYGGPLRCPVPDIERTDWFLMVGANPMVSNGSLMTVPDFRGRLAALQARGGKLIVVDPRRSETAERADEHHFVVPGTDAAFLLAMLHVLFAEGRVALGACEGLVNGVGEVERIAARFAPERVAARCGIDAATIRRLAREMAEAPSAVAYGRMGTSTQAFGTLATWALDLLCILTGNLDRPGGAMFARPAAPLHFAFEPNGAVQFGRWRSRAGGRHEIVGELPVMALAEEIETPGDGQVRALVTVAGNPVRTAPNSARIERAIASLDFVVCLDWYRNETTRHAHLILPPPGPFERSHYDLGLAHFGVRNFAKYAPAALDPEPGARSAWTTALELARRWMGLASLAAEQVDGLVLRQFATLALAASPWQGDVTVDELVHATGKEPGPDRILDALIRVGPYGDACGRRPEGLTLARIQQHPHGLDLGPLVPMLPGHVRTASGRIELAPERIVADVPRLEAWLAREEAPSLRLVNRRDLRSMNSWLHNLPSLAKGRERCTLQMHPDDARACGLADGAIALVRSRVGELRAPVEITRDVMRGVVSLPHGFGHDGDGIGLAVAARKPGANVNAVTDDAPADGPSGAAVLFGGAVEVVAAG
ncbi:MAG: molybdopterin-binding oxidoreductase [Proteobacteria bacterium]|nr:MAG: molybdopterin-binding oxidoreductase [Pseudomonadota bacterium]